MFKHVRSVLLIGLSFSCIKVASGQSEDHFAYVPVKPVERTADNAAMGFRSSSVPGVLEMAVPAGTSRIDILNAKGNVVRSVVEGDLDLLDLGSLSRGTWTLRAHTQHGFSIRRFVVLRPGSVAWAVPRSGKRH